MKKSIYIGYDPREADAWRVCYVSLMMQSSDNIPVHSINLNDMRQQKLYYRDHHKKDGQLWDVISDAPMSTEFAISRFLTPRLAKKGWALFCDCDFMANGDIAELFALADPKYAVMVVKHQHKPKRRYKMDGQIQTNYERKNWSSLMLFNCDHPANKRLTLGVVNAVPGRDLHRFFWLRDEEIGELPKEWNHLVGVDPENSGAKMVHFTLGLPRMDGYIGCEYSDDWYLWRRKQTR